MPDFDIDAALLSDASYALAVHSGAVWDWVRLGRFGRGDIAKFLTVKDAEEAARSYPVEGGHYSRYFRQGNWRVVYL